MGNTICFVNNKGGCGKTTTVIAVGEYWARLGKKILFIDLDSQANLTSAITGTDPLTAEWENTIEDAFKGGPEFGLPIVHAMENIDIVPADLDLSGFNEETASQQTREWMLGDLLDIVKNEYDFILIDCPPALGLIAYNALVASDYMVLVANPDGVSYKGVQMCLGLFDQVISNKRLNPNLELLGIIVTRYEHNKVSDLYCNKFREETKELFVEPVIRKSTKLVQSLSFQKSVYDLDPEGKATKDYMAVADELLHRIVIR